MKIAVYTPYLDSVGGGEKYMMTIAESLSEKEDVDVLLDTHLAGLDIRITMEKLEKFHGLNLSQVKFINAPLGKGSSTLKRLLFLKKYNWLFYLTDGSIFFSTAKNSIIHFQVPFFNSYAGAVGKKKLSTWRQAIFNSKFTKDIVQASWPIDGLVIYPPVSLDDFRPLKKKKQVISVGRFSAHTKSKKHDLMVDTFKQLVDQNNFKDLSLHLAGATLPGDKEYLDQLKQKYKGYQVYLHPDVSLEQLKTLYGESLIYWHAQGYSEEDPKKQEHFGISTVEAMASGCIPVVIGLGGQLEIIENGKSGFFWNNILEWQERTVEVLTNEKLQQTMSKKAIERSKLFGKERFCKQINNLVYGDH